jgi:hypothetical protein
MFISSAFRKSTAISLIVILFTVLGFLNTQAQIPALKTKPKPGLVKAAYYIPLEAHETYYNTSAMAFDASYAYLATPAGLYRAPAPLGPASQFKLVGFHGLPIIKVYVHQNVLYVLKYGQETKGGPATEHSFLKSLDHGSTYIPIDNGLQECLGNYCYYLTPTEALFKDDLIYLNAGGGPNLMFSNNGGASWTSLLGTMQQMTCSYQPFEMVGARMLVGGMCLDTAYLRGGTLRPDLMGWTQLPADVSTPPLGLRLVRIIRNKPGTTDVYAGIGGGLLKSTDSGQTFRYVLQYSSGIPVPYIGSVLFSANNPNVIVIGGRDNGRSGPYLAYSRDNGETWYDISPRALIYAGPPGEETYYDEIDFVAQDPQGRIYAGLRHLDTNTIIVLQVRPDLPFLR